MCSSMDKDAVVTQPDAHPEKVSPSEEVPLVNKENTTTTSTVKDVEIFLLLTFCMFLFFGIHNFLQEAIMNVPGFKFGVMLGFMEVFG